MPVDLSVALVGFQTGDPQARQEFPIIAGPTLLKYARYLGCLLPKDVIREVPQEALIILLSSGVTPFDPARGKATAYLFGAVRNAVQRVRASYCPPGTKTRYDKRQRVPDFQPVPFDEARDPATQQNLAAVHGVIDLWRGVPAVLAEIVHEVFVVGLAVGEVARRRGMSRFAVHRQLRTFIDSKQHIL